MFIGFVNFYLYFIKSFSKIAVLFILILKTTRLFEKVVLKELRADNNEVFKDDSGRVDEIMRNLSKSKKTKNNKSRNLSDVSNIGATKPIFLNFNVKKAFNCLK